MAVRQITTTHTAENMCEDVLSQWEIDQSKVSAIVTDNCSNMVAAFKEKVAQPSSGDDEQDGEAETTSVFGDDEFEFLDCEEAHDIAFISYNRIGCFPHTLQLVVNKFQEISEYSAVLKSGHRIVRKCNSSTKATEMLISLSRKKLTKDIPVR